MIKVDFKETEHKRKLVGDYSMIFGTMLLLAASLTAIYALYFFGTTEEDLFTKRVYGFVVAPLLIGFIAFAFYKKMTEDKLYAIPSPLSIDVKKKILGDYIEEEGMYTDYAEGDYLIATTRLYFKQRLQLTVIFTDGAVLLNVVCESSNFGIPFFFYDGWVRRDIAYDITRWGKPKGAYLEPEYMEKIQ